MIKNGQTYLKNLQCGHHKILNMFEYLLKLCMKGLTVLLFNVVHVQKHFET